MRQDFTTWIYRPLGVLIKHLGGWEDPSAIRGAITGALQCLTMGHPYVMKHPQTQMLQFAIAEIGWKETYEESWKEIIQFYTKPIGNGDDGDGGFGDDCDGVVGIADGNDGKRGGVGKRWMEKVIMRRKPTMIRKQLGEVLAENLLGEIRSPIPIRRCEDL